MKRHWKTSAWCTNPEPSNADAFLRSASVYYSLDMSGKAIEDYRKAIELEPDYYKPYQKLGAFYYYRGRVPRRRRAVPKDNRPGARTVGGLHGSWCGD